MRFSNAYDFRPGTLTNQTPTSGANSQGRATRESRDYKQQGIISAASVGGDHKLASDYRFDWQAGLSRGERRTPRRVDWEFRSAANAFPNSYVLGGDDADRHAQCGVLRSGDLSLPPRALPTRHGAGGRVLRCRPTCGGT